jgi:NADPH-dependent ferric siderophore reductase
MPLEERFPRRTGVATLAARRMVSSQTMRLTLRCEGFCDGWPIEQPGEIVTLLFVPPDEPVVLPEQGWRFPDGASQQHWRNYTVRRHRPATGEIDVDVVLHDAPGPACTWAQRAPLGTGVGYAGPRIDFAPREDADWLLLCGDETALPAIAAILENGAGGRLPVIALVEVPDASAETPVAVPAGARLQWVHRDGAPAATTTHLADALREVSLPPGSGQAWGAAESRVARDLRAVLRRERGLPSSHAHARGYWLRAGDWLDEEAA